MPADSLKDIPTGPPVTKREWAVAVHALADGEHIEDMPLVVAEVMTRPTIQRVMGTMTHEQRGAVLGASMLSYKYGHERGTMEREAGLSSQGLTS